MTIIPDHESIRHRDLQARQRIANDLDTNLLVEAAAGTGKTTSIIARIINLIARGACQPCHMAAVTFTRKAASELRERLLRELPRVANQYAAAPSPENNLRCQRLEHAVATIDDLFVGTIHSFCAALISQRPIEFGVDPCFVQLDSGQDLALRQQAWEENLAEMIADESPLLVELTRLGLSSPQLKGAYANFIEHRDVDHWPTAPAETLDIDACRQSMADYLDHMSNMVDDFKDPRDGLMELYEFALRARWRIGQDESQFFRLLEKFDSTAKVVQRNWPKHIDPKAERTRHEMFRQQVAAPGMTYWRQRRYATVVQFIRRAVATYERLKAAGSGMDFTDLLLVTARGLRQHPHLRRYFQQRYSHLLVDEFQDTDPVQAEVIAWLAAADHESSTPCSHWQECQLRPGALFIVGDPKQSIYRFRRGDIATYLRVKQLFQRSGGTVIELMQNFRSCQAILDWNNSVFAERFPHEANVHAPAHCPMFPGHANGRASAHAHESPGLQGLYKLTISSGPGALKSEAQRIAAFIRHSVDQRLPVAHWSPECEAYVYRPASAADFLLITRNRKHIGLFKLELEAHGLACDVAGSNALAYSTELQILLSVLRAADDPYNPVHYLSLMRDRLFGFSDDDLFQYKRAGGSFVFTHPIPHEVPNRLRERIDHARQILLQAQRWLRELPAATALENIASELGMMAQAASSEEGNALLGNLLKAIEIVREKSCQFDSAADLVTAIDELLMVDEAEGALALTLDQPAVRIMNLHKAKGLEAPIVFLCDGSKHYAPSADCHIAREGGSSLGVMCISEKKNFHLRTIAEPVGWPDYEAEEGRYLQAEETRLHYVATTRAAQMLVITQTDQGYWQPLEDYLRDAPELPHSVSGTASTATTDGLGTAEVPTTQRPIDRWQDAMRAQYAVATVKKESLKGQARPAWQTADEDGIAWGTAMHQLLDICSRSDGINLPVQAAIVAQQCDLATWRIEELVQAVESVTRSQLWSRSRRALRRFSEVPFELLEVQHGMSTVIRGVIDLVFEERDGWTIVDYKSDQVAEEDAHTVVEYYRHQIDQYARYWQQLTGMPVKERGLYLTRLDRYLVTN